jgi:hypothetical protein
MKRLDELFEVRNGLASSQVEVVEDRDDTYSVAYLCPSKTQAGAIAGFVNPDTIPEKHLYPAGTLHVSTDGEGSHTYSYVSIEPVVPNSNVCVLLPREPMSEKVLRFYAYAITKNRPRFNYARKPKGDRLGSVMLPEAHELPEWLEDVDLPTIECAVGEFAHIGEAGPLPEAAWTHVKVTDLFEVTKGKGPSLADAMGCPGDIPYVTTTDKNNGVAAWIADEPCHEGGVLTVASNGSVGEVFYQAHEFCASGDVAVLTPRFDMSPETALFLCTVLRFEGKTLFSYSRKWGLDRLRGSSVWVPVTVEGSLNIEYIEDVIKASKFMP